MPPKMVWERLQDLPFDGGSKLTCKAVGDYFLVLRREDCAAVVGISLPRANFGG